MDKKETREALSSAKLQNIREEYTAINFYPWQKKAMDLITHQQSEILWIYDSVGASGKTALLKHLEYSSGFQYLSPMSLSKLSCFINPEANGYCFDISRFITKEQIRTIHEVVEKIKKERAVPKRGYQVPLKSSKIVIASNALPDLQLPAANLCKILNVGTEEILGGKNDQAYHFYIYFHFF